MTIHELYDLLIEDIVKKISQSKGLSRFVFRRAKFEGWLKVEIIDTLVKRNIAALPEIGRIDVSFDNVAIELKTVNTNIAYNNVEKMTRPITKNIAEVIKDIHCLQDKPHNDKFVIFVAFPIEHSNSYWQIQLQKINNHLNEMLYKEFHFHNDVPGVIYIGRVPNNT